MGGRKVGIDHERAPPCGTGVASGVNDSGVQRGGCSGDDVRRSRRVARTSAFFQMLGKVGLIVVGGVVRIRFSSSVNCSWRS